MAVRRQKSLVLILAREFAAQLTTPVFIADEEGSLVYFNEGAERILGRTLGEAGELTAAEWADTFTTETVDGEPMPLEEMPAGIAMLERRPAHGTFRITGLDGVRRTIEVTAFPLLTRGEAPAGVVAIFWEQGEG